MHRKYQEQPYYIISLYNGFQSWTDGTGKPVTLSYCFVEPTPKYLEQFFSYNLKNSRSFNTEERNTFKHELSLWSKVANVNFIEGNPCKIKIFNTEIFSPRRAPGLTHLQLNYFSIFSSIFKKTPVLINGVTLMYDLQHLNKNTLSHEIGHALLLEHGF